MRRLFAVVVLLGAASCGGGNNSPTGPTPATQTRIINVSGNLNYGQVTVGDVRTDGFITISNTGNATLNVSGINSPCGNYFTASWTGGAISAGATQNVAVRFAPTAVLNCSGVATVNADQTSGTNTILITANVVAGYSKDLTGTWRGAIGIDSIVTLTETSSNLSGTYDAINMKGTVSGSVSNAGQVTFTITVPGFQPITFTGQADDAGNTMSGQVNGSGFSNLAVTLKRI